MVESMSWTVVGGASGGLGRAIARSLAEDGHDVVVAYRGNRAGADETAELVRSSGRKAMIEQVDLAIPDEARAFASRVADAGAVRGVVYAAGPVIPMSFIAKTELETFSRVIDNDLKSCFNLVQPFLPMLRVSSGAVTAIVTPVIERYSKMDLMSSAPKAGVQALIRGIARRRGAIRRSRECCRRRRHRGGGHVRQVGEIGGLHGTRPGLGEVGDDPWSVRGRD